MAELLDTSADDVLGKLVRVWSWFDIQSLDGHAGSVTGVTLKKFIDRLVASQGFAACMVQVGWLTDSGMPNFDAHNGESAKKRAVNAKRQSRLRHAARVTEALPEKRREDITPIVPARFAEFWESYPGPRRISKSKCLKFWGSNHLDPLADQILSHVTAMRNTEQWRKDGNKFAPSTLTYLNQRRWEDGQPLSAEDSRRLAV